MGTKGAYGFFKNGKTKVTYNHYDSYPSVLGHVMIDFVKNHPIKTLNKIFDRIELIDIKKKPTPEQIKECEHYTNLSVSTQSTDDWYCLLRNTQGIPQVYSTGLFKYMIDCENFFRDNLFCKWAYIINLDKNVLEIYKELFLVKEIPFEKIRKIKSKKEMDEYINLLTKELEGEND